MLLVWKATWRPTNAPSVPVIMKLPYLIRFTLMPASLAPRMLPPTATVCSPHLVRLSRIWKKITSTMAQVIMAQA